MEEDQLQPLNEYQVSLLKRTLKVMDTDKLAMRFYTALFVKHPEVKHLFPGDLTELSTKIVSVFELVAYSFVETGPGKYVLQQEVIKPLRTLGKLHTEKGVNTIHYPMVNEVLLESMRQEAPGHFTADTEHAWKLALNHLTFAMLSENAGEPNESISLRESYQQIKTILFKT